MATSSAVSTGCTFFLRQASEQNLMLCQFFAHFVRHVISRPHRTHDFGACSTIWMFHLLSHVSRDAR